MYPWIEILGQKIPSYLVIISLTYCMAIYYLLFRARKSSLERIDVLDSALVIMLSGFIGARLFHVFYEEPNYYLNNPLDILAVWQGGFVYFGGAIASFFAVKVFAKRKKIALNELLDLYAPVIILGYGLGRLSCFAAGCCFGGLCDLPWAISYPSGVEAPADALLHPTPLYASLFAVLHWLFIIKLEASKSYSLKVGQLFYTALLIHGFGRILLEYFREDHRGFELSGLSVSTLISIVLIIIASGEFSRITKSK